MKLRLPPQLRIIVIPSDDTPTREYSLRRGLLLGLGALLLSLAALTIAVLASYGSLSARLRAAEAGARGAAAAADQARIEALSRELEQMRALQEKLLTMLGVEPPADDGAADGSAHGAAAGGAGAAPLLEAAGETVAPAPAGPPGEPLAQGARLIMTPPPDLWPVAGRVTRGFLATGEGRTPPHEGIDLAAEAETPIRSAGKGRVIKVGQDAALGNYVEIAHGFGYVTVYGHCSRVIAREGDRVDRGQVIAHLGATGQATAPHLHFEVWKDGVAVDPRQVIPGDPGRGGK